MAEVKPNQLMEMMTAAYLVKNGKANPEQQKLAYEWYCKRIQAERDAMERPSGVQKRLERNLLIAQYMELCEQSGEKISQMEACRQVAEDCGMQGKEKTVIREFSRWKNDTPEEEKVRQFNRSNRRLATAVKALFKPDE